MQMLNIAEGRSLSSLDGHGYLSMISELADEKQELQFLPPALPSGKTALTCHCKDAGAELGLACQCKAAGAE